MYSAFGVDHGEISKARVPKLGLVRPKTHGTITDAGGKAIKDVTQREGTWALKAKQNTTSWEGDKVVNSSSGGGLTGRGKLAAGGAGAAAAGGGYAARRKVKGY